MDPSASTLIVAFLVLAAPVLTRAVSRWVKVPILVFELVLGIVVGPSVLDWVQQSDVLAHLSTFGVDILFFVAGTEVTRSAMTGRTAHRAWLGWLISIAAGIGAGFLVSPGLGAVIIGISLASTALGTLMPILRDSGVLGTPLGDSVGAIGVIGEFGPIFAISLFLGSRSFGTAGLVLIGFVVIAVLALVQVSRVSHHRLHDFVEATMHTSAQFAVRAVIAILTLLVFLAALLDIDILVGAFTAGILWRLMIRDADEETRQSVEAKIDAVAFGFLVPIFFVYTGVKFDLQALLQEPLAIALIPVVLVALLVIRGLPSMLAAPEGSTWSERIAVGLFGATGLPIIVVVSEIGMQQDVLDSADAAILVGGGVLSVLIFPLLAVFLRDREAASAPA